MNIRLNGSSKNIINNDIICFINICIQFIFRMIIEQMNCERDKLKYDVDTANKAVMLAQEVDENHIRLEKSSANKIA
jgi:hypothetical protein